MITNAKRWFSYASTSDLLLSFGSETQPKLVCFEWNIRELSLNCTASIFNRSASIFERHHSWYNFKSFWNIRKDFGGGNHMRYYFEGLARSLYELTIHLHIFE